MTQRVLFRVRAQYFRHAPRVDLTEATPVNVPTAAAGTVTDVRLNAYLYATGLRGRRRQWRGRGGGRRGRGGAEVTCD